MLEEYRKLSTIMYEQTKPIGYSILGDLEYYLDKIQNIKGCILEAGVGTGRLLIPYLELGLNMEGLDLSEDMLKVCENNLNKNNLNAKLYRDNLIHFEIKKFFDAIIVPSGTFCLITDIVDSIKVLSNFYNHLNKNGMLVLDILFPISFEENTSYSKLFELNTQQALLFTQYKFNLDYENQIMYQLNKYELWSRDVLVDTELSKFDIKWFGINELTMILKNMGFRDITYEFDYGNNLDKSICTFTMFK